MPLPLLRHLLCSKKEFFFHALFSITPHERRKTGHYKRFFDGTARSPEGLAAVLWLRENNGWAEVFPSVSGAIFPLYHADSSDNAGFRTDPCGNQ